MLHHTERDSINDKLKLEIYNAIENWVNSLVDYHLQHLNIPDDSIFDIAASIKKNLKSHSASFVARMTFNIDREQETIEAEINQLLRASSNAERFFATVLNPSGD